MPKEATLYSPIVRDERGVVSVIFSQDHPGYQDTDYQAHRSRIAEAALRYVPGGPIPDIAYTPEEHAMWQVIGPELAAMHQAHACAEFLAAAERLALPVDRLPQLSEVSLTLQKETGFVFAPAAGLVEVVDFYGSLADRRFQATQFIRHPSTPRFSPEPDMIHEIVGHGTHLSSPRLAALYELVGQTVRRLQTPDAVSKVSSLFWFALECGLVREGGEVKACGASLVSSTAELEQFQRADIKGLDASLMVGLRYPVEVYQPVLFCAESFDHLEDFLSSALEEVTDDSPGAAV
jgi:phenylalanine-4-hydroxylase